MKPSEALFKGLVDSAPDAVVVVDKTGRIVLVNAQAEKLFGYGREELINQTMEMLVPERFRGRHPGNRAGYEKDPKTRSMGSDLDLYALNKSGIEFPVEISLSPLATEDGMLYSSAIRDISTRKKLEQELKEQIDRAEMANHMKSRFLANMSHELRTPLNSIIGFSEIIHDGKAGPINADQKEYLGDVLASSRHLLQLINDVLDLSKVEAGKTKFTYEPVDLAALLAQAGSLLRTQAEKRRINIQVHADAGIQGVVGDAARLTQVLYNYLSNAIKFSPEGGEVWVRAKQEGPEHYRLEVQDLGIGISPEDQGQLFTEFLQLDAGSNKKYQGTGLGLALSKKIIEALGGQVGLDSRVGQGSTFCCPGWRGKAASNRSAIAMAVPP
jgi:PAS domain S-box-containing protein